MIAPVVASTTSAGRSLPEQYRGTREAWKMKFSSLRHWREQGRALRPVGRMILWLERCAARCVWRACLISVEK